MDALSAWALSGLARALLAEGVLAAEGDVVMTSPTCLAARRVLQRNMNL